MSEPVDLPALRARLREYDPNVPRCHKPIEVRRNHAPDHTPEYDRAVWDVVVTNRCCRPAEHEGPCRNTRLLLGWPGLTTLTALLDEIERLRENAEARERFHRREHDLLRAAERERDTLRAENGKLRDVLEWSEAQCPGKCAGVCGNALTYAAERGEHNRGEKE